jgi:Flp pilus assembly protein TadB
MGGMIIVALTAVLAVLAVGGAVLAFSGPAPTSRKRVAAVSATSSTAQPSARIAMLANQQRRKTVQQLLKDLERQQSERRE